MGTSSHYQTAIFALCIYFLQYETPLFRIHVFRARRLIHTSWLQNLNFKLGALRHEKRRVLAFYTRTLCLSRTGSTALTDSVLDHVCDSGHSSESSSGDDGEDDGGNKSDEPEVVIEDKTGTPPDPSQGALAQVVVPDVFPEVPLLPVHRNPVFPRFVKMLEVTENNMYSSIHFS